MAITISGENNNDRILAQDGVIDEISGINIVGLLTAGHINVGSNIQLGNAGIITATTFNGNLTGNVNSTSPLLLQTGGSERIRLTSNNEIGIAGANYGSSGQVLTSGGSGSAVSWTTPVTISNNSDNRIITGGSGNNLNGESTLNYGSGHQLTFSGSATPLSGTSLPYSVNIYRDGGSGYGYFDTLTNSSYSTGVRIRTYNNTTYNNVIEHTTSKVTNFQTNGSTRLTIDSSGRLIVGGGTHAGGSALVVKGGGVNTYSTVGLFGATATPSNNAIFAQIRFGSGTTQVGATINAKADADWGSSNDYPTRLEFYTAPDGSGSVVERLRITSDGKVGINETSPDNLLHVRSDNTAAAKIGGEGGSAYYMEIGQLTTSSSPGFNATGSNASMLFKMNGSEKFRLGPSGQFGLNGANYGTSGQVLTSQGNSATPTWTTLSGTTINNNADNRIITGSGTANTLNGESNFTYNGTSCTLKGTTDGVLNLDTTDSRGSFIRFQLNGTSKVWVGCGQGLSLGDQDDLGLRATDNIIMRAGSAERLRIDSSGRVGINRTPTLAYSKLEVGGADNYPLINVEASGVTGGLGVGNSALKFYYGTSLKWRITSNGELYPEGNYKIGLNSNVAFRMSEVNSNKFVHRYGTSGSATTNQQEAIWYGGGITVMHDNGTLSTSNYTWGLTGSRGYPLFRVRNFSSGGAIYAESGTISSGSDYRMKENIVEITNGIETVKKLKPSIFNIRKSFNPNDDGKKHHGFIAHEVQEAIPDIGNIVSGVKDGMEEVFYGVNEDDVIPEGKKAGDSTGTFTDKPDYQGIDYGHMTPILAAAIKELITKVETLEAEVATLKGS